MIATPEVFKSANSDCYIVFGEAKVRPTCLTVLIRNSTHDQIEDMNSSAQLSAAQHLASSGAGVSALAEKRVGEENEDDEDIPDLEAAVEEDEEPMDETGVDVKDIDLVMQQVGCSRAKAVRVLKESGGDLINASTYPSPVFFL